MNVAVARTIIKKLGLSVFSVLYIWGVVATNFELKPPELSSPALTQRVAALHQQLFVWSAVLVIRQYWNMFIPPDTLRWRVTVSGIMPDGGTVLVPIPHQTPRNFWQRNFSDYREVKFIQNLAANGREMVRANYAQYLCRAYQGQPYPLTAITFDYYSQVVLSPAEHKQRNLWYDPAVQHYPLGVFPCR